MSIDKVWRAGAEVAERRYSAELGSHLAITSEQTLRLAGRWDEIAEMPIRAKRLETPK
jgi:hypothetical protein